MDAVQKPVLTAFIDAEYSDLPGTGEPVSIAVVADEACFYAEFPLPERGSTFYEDTVLPLLEGNPQPLLAVGPRLNAFLQSLAGDEARILVVHDVAPDFELLKRLLDGLPMASRLRSVLFVPDDTEAFDAFFCPVRRPRHHALNDARALAAAYGRPAEAAVGEAAASI